MFAWQLGDSLNRILCHTNIVEDRKQHKTVLDVTGNSNNHFSLHLRFLWRWAALLTTFMTDTNI
jgi:hypothetical protein